MVSATYIQVVKKVIQIYIPHLTQNIHTYMEHGGKYGYKVLNPEEPHMCSEYNFSTDLQFSV